MTSLRYRSRTIKRIKKTSPGHQPKVYYKSPKPKSAICGVTKKKLHGFPRLRQSEFRLLSKSKKRPNRKYGGTYSHSVVKKALQRDLWSQ